MKAIRKCPKCGAENWKRSKRKHNRIGRFFVDCGNCGFQAQASQQSGYLDIFLTSRPQKSDDNRKEVCNIRLSKNDKKDIIAGRKHLTIVKDRITLAV